MDNLYFIQAESGHVKIGRAIDVRKRKSSLQSGCFEKLTLRAVLEGRGYEEKVWHIAFRDMRLNGEWFAGHEALDEAIQFAVEGKNWWDHLEPPLEYELSDDPDEYDDDVVDWHIGLQLACAAARDGEKPPTKNAAELAAFGQDRLIERLTFLAEQSVDAIQ